MPAATVTTSSARAHRAQPAAETVDEGWRPARKRDRPASLVVVLGGKAGTGKSVVAANLATSLNQRLGMSTAVIDFCLQFGDQSLMFDARTLPSLVDVLANIDALSANFLFSCMQGQEGETRVLTAPPSPELADLVTPEHFGLILPHLRELFDFVVVDIDSYFTEVSLHALEAADSLVLVTTPHIASVKDTKLILKLLGDMGVDPKKLLMVLNRPEPGLKIGQDMVEANIRFPIHVDLPHTSDDLIYSVTEGKPLVRTKPDSEFAKRMGRLADLLVEATEHGTGEKRRKGLLRLGSG